MPKKQAIVKRSNGNINITIENNLKATQTIPRSEKPKRRRRKPTTQTNEKIDAMLRGGGDLPPLKDVSYIKPPGNSFNVWRDTIDSFNTSIPIGQAQQMGLIMAPPPPAPPTAPLALPSPANNTFNIGNSQPEQSMYNGPSWRDFTMFMSGMTPNRGMPNRDWSNMFDDNLDDEELQIAPPPRPPAIEEGPPIISDSVINAIPDLTDEQRALMKAAEKEKNRIKTAKKEGTRHGKQGIDPQGTYKDMDEYIENYEKALVTKKIEDERKEKTDKINKTAMYNQGKEDATKGITLKYNRKAKDEDYMRGYNEVIDAIPQEAGAASF